MRQNTIGASAPKPDQLKICCTCKFGEFSMTKHNPPRLVRNVVGVCHWVAPKMPLVPFCYSLELRHARHIWWDETTTCPTWEPKGDEGKV